jgi:tetratricopeptide (TPR) repeat protein
MLKIILLILSLCISAEEIPDLGEIKPQQDSPKIKFEISKLSQEGQSLLKVKNIKEVINISQKIKSISESNSESYYLNGAINYINGENLKSLKELELALKFNPNHDLSLFLIGLNYLKLNKFESATLYFERACKEASYNPFYRYNLSIVYYINGKYEKSKQESENTIKLKENYYKAKIILANSLYKLNKKSESFQISKELYDKKIDIEDISPLYIKLLFEESKNYELVIQTLARKPKLSLDEKKILAYSFMEEGEYIKAIQFFKMVIESGIDTEEDNLSYLKSLIMIGKSDEAEKLFTQLNRKNFPDKKIYVDTFFNTSEKKSLLRLIYQPYPL